MSKFLLVVNWKANLDINQSIAWIDKLNALASDIKPVESLSLILCAPYTDLFVLKNKLSEKNLLHVSLSSQDLSRFKDPGPYTGEITASLLAGLVSWVMIGHEERRTLFEESNQIVNQKIKNALLNKFNTLVCFSCLEELIAISKEHPNYQGVLLYEPKSAIGTGENASLSSVIQMKIEVNKIFPLVKMIYGGSVNSGNFKNYLPPVGLDGIGIGKAGLDPAFIMEIVKYVSQI